MKLYYENGEIIPATERTPLAELIEKEDGKSAPDDYREAAERFILNMSLIFSYLSANPNETAIWGVIFGLGLQSIYENKSMSDVADEIGCSRKSISAHAVRIKNLIH